MPAQRPATWTLVSLRPRGGHASLRAAAARHGGRLLALSPWALQPRDDDAARQALANALEAPAVVFTSPAAVRAAAALVPLAGRHGQRWLAVGEGSARALRRAGVHDVQAPLRMDSEGLLALPGLAGVARVGLVTAPGGRGIIAAALQAHGTRVDRADVYARVPLPASATALQRLQALAAPACLAVSSGDALRIAMEDWPAPAAAALRRCATIVASERLATLAREFGLDVRAVAGSPRPGPLAAAAAQVAAR